MDSAVSHFPLPGNDRRQAALGYAHVLPDETLCAILEKLQPRDVARLSCASSVMYVLCNEEPLWMSLCLKVINRPLEYKGSWKRTTLHQLNFLQKYDETHKRTLYFEGFSSLYLYRRLYRCHTSLSGFSFDDGNVKRRKKLSLEEFDNEYDGKYPVLIDGLADSWPARKSWTCEQLLHKYGETQFRISQRSPKKIKIKFKDYVSYMQVQHDEDPLYIFDDKFGESEPEMLNDYAVPHIFQEDYFSELDIDNRPAFRWLIIGPERSGASWHVDPGLTSAWNTLLCGRKRWALYPPGRVPLGVTVHVNEDDGDVDIETPSSLQWWLDFYPLLGESDKPIECTQLPGETIYVPSGWWHCVLNLDSSIAVTQNFVNSKNFEFVCLDMAPGYHHKGVCRAGLLALDPGLRNAEKASELCDPGYTALEKRAGVQSSLDYLAQTINDSTDLEYSYDINFLAMFLDKERDHYTSPWSSGNCIGQREMREWLSKLWLRRPELKDLVWKGACLAFNAEKWYERAVQICSFHGLSFPMDDEKLPVGTGSNPVFLVGDYVIKIFAEGGLEASLYDLGTELEFYNVLISSNASLKNCIPSVIASGILVDNGSYQVFPWDGKDLPDAGVCCNLSSMNSHKDADVNPFGIWGKKWFQYQCYGRISLNSGDSEGSLMWPYIVTRRCSGKILANLRSTLSSEDLLALASFLGSQLRNLHSLPLPKLPVNYSLLEKASTQLPNGNEDEVGRDTSEEVFIRILDQRRKDVASRLANWGEPIPSELIKKVDEYLPADVAALLEDDSQNLQGDSQALKCFTWIHSDIMEDNIYVEPCCSSALSPEGASDPHLANKKLCNRQKHSWYPSYILDFSNLSIGEPLLDFIPVHLDVFRGDSTLLKEFLDRYKVPIEDKHSVHHHSSTRPSYRAMCYCILHEENVLGAIFSLSKELRNASSWQEVEEKIWGDLNRYSF